jgi:hypothetical protein
MKMTPPVASGGNHILIFLDFAAPHKAFAIIYKAKRLVQSAFGSDLSVLEEAAVGDVIVAVEPAHTHRIPLAKPSLLSRIPTV